MRVCNLRSLGECLESVRLDLLIVYRDRPEQSFHDKLALRLDCEIGTGRWDCSCEGFDGELRQLDVLSGDIANRRVQDLPNLLLQQLLVKVFVEELAE